MRIAISTISKNEDHNVRDFVKSCKEADLISVLDTGSTDKTVELLKKHKAFAGSAKIEPFRFDEARNKALELLPKEIDIVVALDLDERLSPGWRKALEKIWKKHTDMAFCRYVEEWQDKEQTNPLLISRQPKIFKRNSFQWLNPVCEGVALKNKKEPNIVKCEEITIYHYRELTANNISLLTKWLKEKPDIKGGEIRYFQRGNDYLRMGKDKEAINDFEQYLEMSRHRKKESQVENNRAASHLKIARAKFRIGVPAKEILQHFLRAVAESPSLREAWTYLADGWMAVGNYPAAFGASLNALKITDPGLYSQETTCWGDFPKQIAEKAYERIRPGQNPWASEFRPS